MADGGPGDELPEAIRLHAFAALAGRLEADHRQLVEFLADGLARALPGAVTVHRGGVFGSGRVSSVEVLVGERQYELQTARGHVETVVAHVVAGVVLRRDTVPVDAWVEGLLGDVERLARDSEATRAALQRLLR